MSSTDALARLAAVIESRKQANGGNPDTIYKPLDGWKPGGSRAGELAFWMS